LTALLRSKQAASGESGTIGKMSAGENAMDFRAR